MPDMDEPVNVDMEPEDALRVLLDVQEDGASEDDDPAANEDKDP